MKSFVTAFCVVLLSTAVQAEQEGRVVEVASKPGSALKVTLSGDLDLDFVYRGPIINETSFWQPAGAIATFGLNAGESASDFNDGQNMLNGALKINLLAELKDKVSVHSTFGNLRAVRSGTNPVTDNLNLGDPSSRSSTDLIFYDLYVQFEELVDPRFGLKAGQVSSYNIDFTGRGNPIFFAPGYSESPWSKFELTVAYPETNRDTNLPAGFIGSFDVMDALDVDLVVLPFIVSATEGRSHNGNEGAYLLTGNYKLDTSGSQLGGLFGFLRGPSDIDTVATVDAYDGGTVWVLGAGGVHKTLMPNFEFFGELYWEFGNLAETNVAALQDLDINAYAFQFGGKYNLSGTGNPWVEASLLWLTGEDDHSTANGNLSLDQNGAANDDIEEFLSYEANNDFLILENQLFGLDIDTNYWALKFKGGITVGVVDLIGKLGFFTLVEDVRVGANTEDQLGTELDLGAIYPVNDSVSFDANFGYLFGSDVIERFTSDKDDIDYMVTVGTTVKF